MHELYEIEAPDAAQAENRAVYRNIVPTGDPLSTAWPCPPSPSRYRPDPPPALARPAQPVRPGRQ